MRFYGEVCVVELLLLSENKDTTGEIVSGGGNNETFAMTCFEDGEDDKNKNGDDENKFESKNSVDDERKVGPGTSRNTKEPPWNPTDAVIRFYDSSHERMGNEHD